MWLRIFALTLLVLSAPALAHSPYTSDPLTCPAPEGEEYRLLFGDGLFGPDPVALAALDAEGRLLAFQDVDVTVYPVALRGTCVFVDPWNGTVWQRNADDDGPGVLILGGGEQARDNRWMFEPGVGHDGFGFEAASLATVPVVHRLRGELVYRWRAVVAHAALIFAALTLLWVTLALPRRQHWGLRIFLAVAGGLGAVVLMLPLVVAQAMVPLSGLLTGGAAGVALAALWLLQAALRRLAPGPEDPAA